MPTALPMRSLPADVVDLAVEVCGDAERAEAWLNQPAIGLDRKKPIDFLHTPAGTARVRHQRA